MRVLLALTLLLAVVSAGEDKMKKEIKMWMKMKAMESCLGEDIVKAHMIKVKKAAAKCSGMDAPELDLPMFDNSYKLVSALTGTYGSGSSGSRGNGIEKMMKGFLRLQMLQALSGSDEPRTFVKRAADDDVFELGERLTEKLRMKKDEFEHKMGNYTCMLQECGILDAQEKFNPVKAKREWKETMASKDKWLKEKLEWACDNCEKMANNLPKGFLDKSPYGPEMCKVKMFKECMYKTKMYTCMKFDLKKKLEKHFGDVKELTESTGMTEDELFMAVKSLLKGPEEMYM